MADASISVNTLAQIVAVFATIVGGIVAISTIYQRQFVQLSISKLELRLTKRMGRMERRLGCEQPNDDEDDEDSGE